MGLTPGDSIPNCVFRVHGCRESARLLMTTGGGEVTVIWPTTDVRPKPWRDGAVRRVADRQPHRPARQGQVDRETVGMIGGPERCLAWTIVDLPSIATSDHAENEIRKAFTPMERVAIGKTLEAEMGEWRGHPSESDGKKRDAGPTFSEEGRNRDISARSGETILFPGGMIRTGPSRKILQVQTVR